MSNLIFSDCIKFALFKFKNLLTNTCIRLFPFSWPMSSDEDENILAKETELGKGALNMCWEKSKGLSQSAESQFMAFIFHVAEGD